MSALLHPLHGAREKCRPKHQVLVLRCYPKFQKNVQEVKPSSSELSYLLYYASTRRSKLQKVGTFLEKKTASDVWRNKLGNVQVTLQIVTSIIEKAPRDLSLYAGSVLTILNTVLASKDINMVEESIPTLEAYCKYVDPASLAADQGRAKQYRSIIHQYAAFGAVGAPSTGPAPSIPLANRRRTIALKAIRAVVGSDALGADTADQLNTVMPVILENLDLETGGSLAPLQQKASTSERQSVEMARKRRMSATTVPSVDEVSADPAMASETTADADKLAEEEVRVLAIRCLKQIFSVSTGTGRTQMRLATALVLRYIATKDRPRPWTRTASHASFAPDWATTLFETIARWTPVQDRFIIVIVAVETLVRSPIVESILEKQLMLATLVDWILKSDINLIGLSVMDVLLRLIQHTLVLLQLGARDGGTLPQAAQADPLGLYKDIAASFDPVAIMTEPERGRIPDTREAVPSPVRKELLAVLQKCISDLATHIYYTDQISDMLTAIMARLKPSPVSDIPTAAAAVNDPAGATKAIADSANLQEDPATDGFFSFATARVVALKAVKEILQTANSRRTSAGAPAEVRSRVGIQVWDGTQWLLKDEDPQVRVAYVDAVVTWLRLETNKGDLLLPTDGSRKPRSSKRDAHVNRETSIAKRAVSNASRKGEKQPKSTYLQLLHLAIYDDAIERADNESSVLLLYLLLWTLVERLGVNAIRTGLPMMLNLQGAVLNASDHPPVAKTRIANLVHGYLWSIAEKFDFESSAIGTEINAEISRRKRFGCWCDRMKFPPAGISHIAATSPASEAEAVSSEAVDSLRPFLNVNSFVAEIAAAYDRALISPPSSPPASPGRVFSVPTLGFGYGYTAAPVHKPSPERQLPQKIKDEMCGSWSREACIAAVDKESNPSIAGSRTAPSSTGRHHLSINPRNNGASGPNSPQDPDPAHALPVVGGLGSLTRVRNFSTSGSLRDPETSSRDSTMRMTDLKRALAGANGELRGQSPLRSGRPMSRSRLSTRSSGSESMVSWNPADDDSLIEGDSGEKTSSRPGTGVAGGPETTSVHDKVTRASSTRSNPKVDDDIPPVPKIPSTLNLPMAGTWPRDASPVRPVVAPSPPEQLTPEPLASAVSPPVTGDGRPVTNSYHHSGKTEKKKRPASRAGGASVWSHSTAGRKADLTTLLASITTEEPAAARDLKAGKGSGLLKPPY